MLYRIESQSGIILATDLDEHAPAIRLDEGRVAPIHDDCQPPYKGPKPRDLAVGECTDVSYPLIGRTLIATITRTE